MDLQARVKALEALLPKPEIDLYDSYNAAFEKQAGYKGNGVYAWHNIYANDTRVLWLLGILAREGVLVPPELG